MDVFMAKYGDGENMGTGDVFTNKFTCNFIEGEGNTGWKETYYINPADIRRFLNRNRDEKLHWRKMAEYDRFLEKYEKSLTNIFHRRKREKKKR